MIKVCSTCAYNIKQFYNGVPLIYGSCIHWSFIKAGYLKIDENGEMNILHKGRRDRLNAEQVIELRNRGYYYLDLTDVRKLKRICPHWVSNLAYAPDVLKVFGKEIAFKINVPKEFYTWFNSNFPMKLKILERPRPFHLFEYKILDIIEEDFKDYNPCSICQHFCQSVNIEGAPIPFKGKCIINSLDQGVFSLLGQEPEDTYTFLSCDKFMFNVAFKSEKDTQELSAKVFSYIETNPVDLTLGEFQYLFRFPRVWIRTLITKEDHDKLISMDLLKLLKNKVNQINFIQFYKDMKFDVVDTFFTKRIKKLTKKDEVFYNQFKDYDSCDLFHKKS